MGKEHCQCSFPIISYIQSNDADCALSQTDYFASFNKYTITGKWSL